MAWLKRRLRASGSPLIQESFARPGGWRSMELVYGNAQPVDWIDRQALRWNPISIAARNRRRYVVSRLREWIGRYAAEGPVTIVGVGSGPGTHVQQALVESGVDPRHVQAWLVDRDNDAFEFGQAHAGRLGVAGSMRFVRGDARQLSELLPDARPQIVKVIGLIEYLTDAEVLQLLRSLRAVMPAGGTLITHGLVDRHDTGPFLSRIFNLTHVQRGEAQLRELLRAAGFRTVECFVEPVAVYPIVTAEPDV